MVALCCRQAPLPCLNSYSAPAVLLLLHSGALLNSCSHALLAETRPLKLLLQWHLQQHGIPTGSNRCYSLLVTESRLSQGARAAAVTVTVLSSCRCMISVRTSPTSAGQEGGDVGYIVQAGAKRCVACSMFGLHILKAVLSYAQYDFSNSSKLAAAGTVATSSVHNFYQLFTPPPARMAAVYTTTTSCY